MYFTFYVHTHIHTLGLHYSPQTFLSAKLLQGGTVVKWLVNILLFFISVYSIIFIATSHVQTPEAKELSGCIVGQSEVDLTSV